MGANTVALFFVVCVCVCFLFWIKHLVVELVHGHSFYHMVSYGMAFATFLLLVGER